MKASIINAVAILATTCACSAVVFPGNTGTGFGGPVGTGSLEITQQGTSTLLDVVLTRGLSGDLNDQLSIYIDSVAGGFTSTVSFDDFGDPSRSHISSGSTGNGGDAGDVIFPTGFEADYAISISGGFASLFQLASGGNNAFTWIDGTAQGGNNSATFSLTIDLADLGLVAGDSFEIVSTYGHGGYQSDESFNNLPNTGNYATNEINMATLGVSALTVSTIPEPSTMSLMFSFGALALAVVRRRQA